MYQFCQIPKEYFKLFKIKYQIQNYQKYTERECSVCPTQITMARKKQSTKKIWRATIFLLPRQKISLRIYCVLLQRWPIRTDPVSQHPVYLRTRVQEVHGQITSNPQNHTKMARNDFHCWNLPNIIMKPEQNKYERSARPWPITPIKPKHLCWKWCIM